jgi:hypothetical protein
MEVTEISSQLLLPPEMEVTEISSQPPLPPEMKVTEISSQPPLPPEMKVTEISSQPPLPPEIEVTEISSRQCCESGSGIRCLFDPWIRDPGWVESQHPDLGSGMNNPDPIF